MKRGEIWWATLPKPRGSEPGCIHPVLIVQDDRFNRSRINTVIAVLITSITRLAAAPGNVLLPRKASGLPKPSVANVSQILTLDKSMLTQRVKKLAPRELSAVDEGLRLILSLRVARK